MDVINKILELFLSDTIELLDRVIDDDINDPQFSAIGTIERLNLYFKYFNLDTSINDFLLSSGYSSNDIEIFLDKYRAECKNFGYGL